MKRCIISIIFVFILVTSISSVFNYSLAADSIDSIIQEGQDFISEGKENKKIQTVDGKAFSKNVKLVFSILFIVGMVVSVGAVLILGIQFMIGAAEEKAKIKEKLVPYLIGTVIIFGAYTIWRFTMIFLGNFE